MPNKFLVDVDLNKIDSVQVSLAGEFAVLSQLALRGFNANMTLGHTKGVDILVADPRSDKMFKLEVKTNLRSVRTKPIQSKTWGEIVSTWILGDKNELITDSNLFYCFVNIEKETKKFSFYIVPSKVVAKYVKEEHELWCSTHPNPNKAMGMRNFRLGLKGCSYEIDTPTVEAYEDNWKFEI